MMFRLRYWPLLPLSVVVGMVCASLQQPVGAQKIPMPVFELDPNWPKALPNNWAYGDAWGIATDARDHVWMVHAKSTEGLQEFAREGKLPPPPVVELDAQGNFVQGWGGFVTNPTGATSGKTAAGSPGPGTVWMEGITAANPIAEHGIWVDHTDHVWLTGYGGLALKFTRDGKFVLQIGELWKTNGDDDRRLLGDATSLAVDPQTNELYIADGYTNHRLIVFDATTGAYKRHWGAYGKPPVKGPPMKLISGFDPQAPPPDRFNPPHCARISKDGFVYVCDRGNNRFQVFRKDGTFVKEVFVEKEKNATHAFDRKAGKYVLQTNPGNFVGSASAIGFSADPQQRYLYVGGSTSYPRIFVFNRSNLELLGSFDTRGNHEIAVDSKGNIYTTDGYGRTPQRYLLKTPAGGANN